MRPIMRVIRHLSMLNVFRFMLLIYIRIFIYLDTIVFSLRILLLLRLFEFCFNRFSVLQMHTLFRAHLNIYFVFTRRTIDNNNNNL